MKLRRNRAKSRMALFLLGALGVASLGHYWHHVLDPDCGTDGRHGAQPCATCASLHSAVVAAPPQPPPQLYRTSVEPIPPLTVAVPAHPIVPGGAPRAPPAA
jgi:hypothetical protein